MVRRRGSFAGKQGTERYSLIAAYLLPMALPLAAMIAPMATLMPILTDPAPAAFARQNSSGNDARRTNQPWTTRLGADPIYRGVLERYIKSQSSLRLPDPAMFPARDNWQPVADTGCAFVNLYRLSGDKTFLRQAERIADWLLASNDYLVAHRSAAVPYLGWGPQNRQGYFKCPTVGNYQADDLWDTAAVLRLLLKYSEVDRTGVGAAYLERARKIIDRWAYVDRTFKDGAYAAAGMRWYMKSNDPCEIRYVKNTNIVMGEQLLRIFVLTKDERYLRAAVSVLNSEFWDVLTRHNLAYSSVMIYEDHSDPAYAAMAAQNESKVVHTNRGRAGDEIRCNDHDTSCWNHLGFEGYDLSVIKGIVEGIDGKPSSDLIRDLSKATDVVMNAYRSSKFGDTASFPWDTSESDTYITAYNCAQRFSSDLAAKECVEALKHHNASGTVFYSLVPDAVFSRDAGTAGHGSAAQ
ncbi:MAG TPA: hypothetical protein VI756_30290 [Blastocatellia bacterium]